MPTASETRTIAAPPIELWQVVCDPYRLPRWWPRVERVEGVEGAFFTELLRSSGGKLLRADFEVSQRSDAEMRIGWAQQIAGTPFAHVFCAVDVTVQLSAITGVNAATGTAVTLTLAQRLKGLFRRAQGARSAGPGERGARPDTRAPREVPATALWTGALAPLGRPMIVRAATKTVKEALDGLERLAA